MTDTIEAVAARFTIVRPMLRPIIEVSERPAEIVRVEIFLDRSAPKVTEAVEA